MPTSDAVRRANSKYKSKFRYFHVKLTPEEHAQLRIISYGHGISMQEYAHKAILQRMQAEAAIDG